MRWSYKTVHYELKKEGLLGSSFLDESEVELSLNEYGKSGWELISMIETMDGLIAVFKQPLTFDTEDVYALTEKEAAGDDSPEMEQFNITPLSTVDNHSYDEDVVVVEDFDVVEEVDKKIVKNQKRPVEKVDVGSILIE